MLINAVSVPEKNADKTMHTASRPRSGRSEGSLTSIIIQCSKT
jgi:hypothetical protein